MNKTAKSASRGMKNTARSSARSESEDQSTNLAASTDAFSKFKHKSINSPPYKIHIKLNKDACTFSNFAAKLEKEEIRYKNLTRYIEVLYSFLNKIEIV